MPKSDACLLLLPGQSFIISCQQGFSKVNGLLLPLNRNIQSSRLLCHFWKPPKIALPLPASSLPQLTSVSSHLVLWKINFATIYDLNSWISPILLRNWRYIKSAISAKARHGKLNGGNMGYTIGKVDYLQRLNSILNSEGCNVPSQKKDRCFSAKWKSIKGHWQAGQDES